MIRIIIELVPHGIESQKETLCIGKIWNDTTGDANTGNYGFQFFRAHRSNTIWKTGEIKDFPRKKLSVWYLLHRCLKESIENDISKEA
jgi:hypothetical protein